MGGPVTGRQRRRLFGSEDQLLTLESAVFSPAAPRQATVSNDGRLNLETDAYERHIMVESAPMWAVAFNPSGDELTTANDDDTVRVWYRTNGRLAGHTDRVYAVAFADGTVASASGTPPPGSGCPDRAHPARAQRAHPTVTY